MYENVFYSMIFQYNIVNQLTYMHASALTQHDHCTVCVQP